MILAKQQPQTGAILRNSAAVQQLICEPHGAPAMP
jgi:hypothetical protein